MEGLYQQTNRLVLQIQSQLNKLGIVQGESLDELEQSIDNTLHEVSTNCDRLALLVNKEPPHKRQSAKMERDELLNRKFAPNNSGETSIMIDHALQHNTGLQNANRGMDDMLSSGSSILTGLREQRNMLKGTQKRILDIANTLGLSNTVMRLIDKRATQDKWIVIGGAVVTCIIMFFVVKYLT
ncbi:Golgi SNAP receptor complex member 2 [Exaiptasia diaphana]|nr:Golgi SNAP receptor complex member 2 [Exaiptasia diaphana]